MGRILEYKPVMSSAQRWLFRALVPSLALLGANSLYLLAIPEATQNLFYLYMFLLHLILGFVLLAPFALFITMHIRSAWGRENRRAIRAGWVLLAATVVLLVTGLILTFRLKPAQAASPLNQAIYWGHVLTPLLAAAMYVMHRRAGPRIHWNGGLVWAVCVGLFIGGMSLLHSHDPRAWYQVGSPEGEKYFEPALTRTVSGKFIPARVMMLDDYCKECHEDAFDGWFHSAHRFASFNNPVYLFSIRETRKVAAGYDPDGIPRAARFCAGCHDPVPFLSGKFDDPQYDDVNDPTAQAGITCTVCHAVTNVNSTRGNGDYTIDEPIHYPFTYSENPALKWINRQLVKAKPEFHKKTFLKPFHKTAEFCSACHKVSLPFGLNHYKEFLRAQNHYDSFLLSGVSGHGARSFYYPKKAETSCNRCHMPLAASEDFGARDFDDTGIAKIHTHLFQSANTGIAAIRGRDEIVKAHADYLTGADPDVIGPSLRIDVLGLRDGGEIDNPLIAPIRPELPTLRPGGRYLLEIVLRTLNVGHQFTQGTTDSNQVWVELTTRSGDRIIGHSGSIDGEGFVDPWSHFVNVLMLDRAGNRIERRNPQDIFTPLYNHQLGPGTGQVVHYRLDVPRDVEGPIEIIARLNYRKFDRTLMNLVYPDGDAPALPVVEICRDRVVLPVQGVSADVPPQASPIEPAWQRWNDYGIGLLLEGNRGSEKGELRQAEGAFRRVADLEPRHGLVNLARVYFKEGRLAEATRMLQQAEALNPPADWWTVAWFNGLVSKQNGRFDAAIRNFETILNNPVPGRGFDFSKDYVVLNELGLTLFERAKQQRGEGRRAQRDELIRQATARFEETLAIDSENLTAHYNLHLCYAMLGRLPGESATEINAAWTDSTDDDAFVGHIAELLDHPGEGGLMRAVHDSIQSYVRNRRAADLATLPVLRRLNSLIKAAYRSAGPARGDGGTAAVLAMLHRHEYLAYKPDDNARDKAVAAYRARHPAGNHAAQSIVIYPLTERHRSELLEFYRPAPDSMTAAHTTHRDGGTSVGDIDTP